MEALYRGGRGGVTLYHMMKIYFIVEDLVGGETGERIIHMEIRVIHMVLVVEEVGEGGGGRDREGRVPEVL